MTFQFYLIDNDDGEVLGTNSKAVAEAAQEQGWSVLNVAANTLDLDRVEEADADEFADPDDSEDD